MLTNTLTNRKDNDSSPEITDTTTYEQLFGRYENREPFTTLSRKESCMMFQNKFKEIYDTGKKVGLQAGEVLLLILKYSGGYYLDQIEYGRLSEIKRYIIEQADNFLNTINPELYGTLYHLGYYKKDRYKLATKEELSEFSNNLMQLISRKANYAEFYNLAKYAAENYN